MLGKAESSLIMPTGELHTYVKYHKSHLIGYMLHFSADICSVEAGQADVGTRLKVSEFCPYAYDPDICTAESIVYQGIARARVQHIAHASPESSVGGIPLSA